MNQKAEPTLLSEDETSLAARAAWLHHVGRLTQSEVATRLNVPNVKAHRLIARAGREGMVRVFVDGEIAHCVRLEQQLCRAYGLGFCEVAPDLDDAALPLRALGVLGARYLRLACEKGEDAVIGLGHGRTLAACVESLPRLDVAKLQLRGPARRLHPPLRRQPLRRHQPHRRSEPAPKPMSCPCRSASTRPRTGPS